MNSTIWLAGAGFSTRRAWPAALSARLAQDGRHLSQLPDNLLRRFGGGLVVAGIVIYYMLRNRLADQKVVGFALFWMQKVL
jgi:hypothetical protein